MSLNKNTYSLLFKTLWLPNINKVTALREKYHLPTSALSSLQQEEDPDMQDLDQQQIIRAKQTANHKNDIISEKPASTKEAISEKVKQPTLIKNLLTDINNNLIDNWQDLEKQIIACKNCKLCENRTQVVIERGNRQAKWMFIGEGPGEHEDLQGKPFVGASGQLLDKMIAAMQLDSKQDIYIANVVKCRPPRNRNPEIEEINACKNFLFSQIALVKPQIIITLGRYAAQTLLQSETAIGKLRNKVHYYQDIPLIVTYHPSYLLRTPDAKKDAWADLKLALEHYK